MIKKLCLFSFSGCIVSTGASSSGAILKTGANLLGIIDSWLSVYSPSGAILKTGGLIDGVELSNEFLTFYSSGAPFEILLLLPTSGAYVCSGAILKTGGLPILKSPKEFGSDKLKPVEVGGTSKLTC